MMNPSTSVESFGYLSPSYQFPRRSLSPENVGAKVGTFQGDPEGFPAKMSGSASDVVGKHDDIPQSSDGSFCFKTQQTRPSFSSSVQINTAIQPGYSKASYPNRKSLSYIAIAPQPATNTNNKLSPIMQLDTTAAQLSQPTPFRRSSLLSSSYNNVTVHMNPVPIQSAGKGSLSYDRLAVPLNSSLTAQSPPLEDFSTSSFDQPLMSSPLPTCVSSQGSAKSVVEEGFENPLMLLHWLTQVDLSRYGFAKEAAQIREAPQNRPTEPSATSGKKSSISLTSFLIPAVEQYKRIEGEFMAAVRRQSQQHVQQRRSYQQAQRVPTSSPDLFSGHRHRSSTSASVPSTPKKRPLTSSPKSPSTPRVPYKGRFGLHPTCGSCKTSSTPYWRDSWSNAFILCNACGLRYAKFKRYCNTCSYVPRKEDKNASCCTQCSSAWSFKS